jgi:hypothetical protein
MFLITLVWDAKENTLEHNQVEWKETCVAWAWATFLATSKV